MSHNFIPSPPPSPEGSTAYTGSVHCSTPSIFPDIATTNFIANLQIPQNPSFNSGVLTGQCVDTSFSVAPEFFADQANLLITPSNVITPLLHSQSLLPSQSTLSTPTMYPAHSAGQMGPLKSRSRSVDSQMLLHPQEKHTLDSLVDNVLSQHNCVIKKEGKEEYSCPFCQKTFGLKHNLRSHIVIHFDLKPFHCGVCNASFVRRWDLKRHMKRHYKDYGIPRKTQSLPATPTQNPLNINFSQLSTMPPNIVNILLAGGLPRLNQGM
ncbi:hypothetical protein BKA69DRAFT_1173248 [Paraphysoderma sedebokerense]|nr:hypothetical protein BKA69DRAFT_1173248 [Paraphysoderma sedebokerense]